jgi:hypothetical protein
MRVQVREFRMEDAHAVNRVVLGGGFRAPGLDVEDNDGRRYDGVQRQPGWSLFSR